MKTVHGISLSIGSYERGLWTDHDKRVYNPNLIGIKLDIVCGRMIRPVPCFWKRGFWRGERAFNPWKGGEYWFIIRIPFLIAPFISIALGKYGLYFGCKTFEIAPHHAVPERYGKWVHYQEIGTEEKPAVFLQLTATTRTTRWE